MAGWNADQLSNFNRPEFIATNRNTRGGYWPQNANIISNQQTAFRRTLYGDWGQFRFIIKNMTPRMMIGLKAAARKSAKEIVKNVRKGVNQQAPGGKKLAPLHPFTVKDKLTRKGIGGATANKALMRSGSLMKFLTYKVREDGSFEVGYDGSSTSGSTGVYLWMVATWMSNATTVGATKKLRRRMGSLGFGIRKETKRLVIPKRSFIEPVFSSMKKDIADNYAMAIARALTANPNIGISSGGDT